MSMQFNWQQRAKRSSIAGENPYSPSNYTNLDIENQFYKNSAKAQKRQQQQSKLDELNSLNRPYHQGSSFYDSRYPLYLSDWKSTKDSDLAKVALTSYREDSTNKISVTYGTPHYDSTNGNDKSVERFSFDYTIDLSVNYPITNIQWDPSMILGHSNVDRLAASSECLRLYQVVDNDGINDNLSNNIHFKNNNNSGINHTIVEKSVLTNSKSNNLNQLPPVTSFDWNYTDTNNIIACSIDTTCTLWDLSRGQGVAKTQLIAHDSEVFDVKFIFGDKNVFTSCSSDGSVRVFDLRSLEHSSIIYEPATNYRSSSFSQGSTNTPPINSHTMSSINNDVKSARSSIVAAVNPLLKLSTSKYNANHIATIEGRSNRVLILDLRHPSAPIRTFSHHQAQINSIDWHPHKNYLLTGSDDCQVFCYDLSTMEYKEERKKTSRANSHVEMTSLSVSNTNADANSNSSSSHSPHRRSNSSSTNTSVTSSDSSPDASEFPSMMYSEDMEVNGVCWNGDGDWIGVNSGKRFQAVKVE